MEQSPYLIAALAAVVLGLDRTAVCQFMISRPIVAGSLTGWLLGDPLTGLQIGAMLELLWLGRLPVGATIPPDDTQVAVGSTALALIWGPSLGGPGLGFNVLCVLLALPLSKVGQFFDRTARNANGLLALDAARNIEVGRLEKAERLHLRGILYFGMAAFLTHVVIILVGSGLLRWLAPHWLGSVNAASPWAFLGFFLVGAAVILGSINVSRSFTLFGASFASAFLMLWLL